MKTYIGWFALPTHQMFGETPNPNEEIAEARLSTERPSMFNRWSATPEGTVIGSRLLQNGNIIQPTAMEIIK